MARKRFQKGHVRLRNTSDPYWEGFYWEDLRLTDNQVVRKQRAINLGRSTEIPSKRLAERKLAEKLAEVNDIDYRPRPVTTVKDFVDMRYKKLILPLRKRTTRHGYEVVLAHHILPEFGAEQLVDVTGEDVQAFVTRKSGSGLAWNTVKNIISVFRRRLRRGCKIRVSQGESRSLRRDVSRTSQIPGENFPAIEELQQLQNELDEPYRTMVWFPCATAVVSASCWLYAGALSIGSTIVFGCGKQCITGRSILRKRIVANARSGSAKAIWLGSGKFRKARPRSRDEDWLFVNTRGTAPFLADNVLDGII